MTVPEQCATCNAVGWHVHNCPNAGPSNGDVRDQIAVVLDGEYGSDTALMDALVALVEPYALERAAEVLREAADEAQRLGLLPGNVHGFFAARADRIEAGSSRGAVTTTS